MSFSNVEIHSTSFVDPKAKIGKGSFVGPFCIIGPSVEIGKNVRLFSNVVIEGKTKIGDDTLIHQFVVIGNKSHDLKFTAEQATTVTIGKNCVIREFVNVHAGTPNNTRGTWIGDNVFLMSHTHIGHDCEIHNGAILSQGVTLGGEVSIYDNAIIGGCTAIHQFCSIGKYAIIGGCSKITQDVIPFSMSDGNPQSLDGLNLVGLQRNKFSVDDIRIIKELYKDLFISTQGLWAERLATAKTVYSQSSIAGDIFDFIENHSRRVICKPRLNQPRIDQGEG